MNFTIYTVEELLQLYFVTLGAVLTTGAFVYFFMRLIMGGRN